MARWAESCLAAVIVALLSGAVLGPVFDPDQLGGDGIGWIRIMWLPVYAIIGALALWRWRDLARFWRPAVMLAVLVAWALASTLWAVDPATTGRRAVALLFTTLFGLYLAAGFGPRFLSQVLAATLVALALCGFIACVAIPQLGLDHDANVGAWKGLWYEKNQMGTVMAYGALSATAAALLNPARRGWWVAGALLCAAMVVMSRSVTSLIVLASAMAIIGVINGARRGPVTGLGAAWLVVTLAGLVATAASLFPDAVYRFLGKDATITGRTDIWRATQHWTLQAPWLGYGYQGFWTDDSAPAKTIRAQLGWLVPNAHNGWLDLRLELGWVGVAFVAAVFVVAAGAVVIRGWRLNDGGWAAAFFVTFLFSSLSESLILEQNNLPWVLCGAAIATLTGSRVLERSAPLAWAGPGVRPAQGAEREIPAPIKLEASL